MPMITIIDQQSGDTPNQLLATPAIARTRTDRDRRHHDRRAHFDAEAETWRAARSLSPWSAAEDRDGRRSHVPQAAHEDRRGRLWRAQKDGRTAGIYGSEHERRRAIGEPHSRQCLSGHMVNASGLFGFVIGSGFYIAGWCSITTGATRPNRRRNGGARNASVTCSCMASPRRRRRCPHWTSSRLGSSMTTRGPTASRAGWPRSRRFFVHHLVPAFGTKYAGPSSAAGRLGGSRAAPHGPLVQHAWDSNRLRRPGRDISAISRCRGLPGRHLAALLVQRYRRRHGPITVAKQVNAWKAFVTTTLVEVRLTLRPGGHVAFEVGEVRGGAVRLEDVIVPAGIAAGLEPVLVLVNAQAFTKTANCWGVKNNEKGTNTNRIVLLRKAS